MTRRLFLAMPAVAAQSPKNQLAEAANAFHAQYAVWADAFNKVKPGTIDATENEAFTPLMGLWRKVEHARTTWVRGL